VSGHDDASAKPVLEALAQTHRAPALVLADTTAQEFRLTELPRLNPWDRKKILARRLHQNFPPPENENSQLTVALPLKKNTALLACLHQGGPVQGWLRRLEAISNPSGEVALLPLEGAAILRALLPSSAQGWAMLLSWQRTGGFRQIVTRDGQLLFTRLTPAPPPKASASFITASLSADIQASVEYLKRHGLKSSAELRLAALMPTFLHAPLGSMRFPVQEMAPLTPHQAARNLGLSVGPRPDDPHADLLFAAWLQGRFRLRASLMSPQRRQTQRKALLTKTRLSAAALLWLAAVLLLGVQGHDLARLTLSNRTQTREIADVRQQLQQERRTLLPATEPLTRLRQALERKRLFAEPLLEPWPMLNALGEALSVHARLAKMDWQSGVNGAPPESLTFQLRSTGKDLLSPEEIAEKIRAALPEYDLTVSPPQEAAPVVFALRRIVP
ncbi:MAG: hypothetical protein HGA90_02170, partial [Alphaproteobacteria bacterium]|nr:hypothetical protein [Alphaproteobacteria bacterium]